MSTKAKPLPLPKDYKWSSRVVSQDAESAWIELKLKHRVRWLRWKTVDSEVFNLDFKNPTEDFFKVTQEDSLQRIHFYQSLILERLKEAQEARAANTN